MKLKTFLRTLGLRSGNGRQPSLDLGLSAELKHWDEQGRTVKAEFRVGVLPEDAGYYQSLMAIGQNRAFQQELLKELFDVHRLVMNVPPGLTPDHRSVILAELAERARTLRKILDMPFTAERILHERRKRERTENLAR